METNNLVEILKSKVDLENIVEIIENYGDPDSFDLNIKDFKFKDGSSIHKYHSFSNTWISPQGYLMFTEKSNEHKYLYFIGEETRAEHLFRLGDISIWRISPSRAESLLEKEEDEE